MIKPTLAIVRYDDSVRSAAEEVFKQHSKDKRLSYCDALSFVIITDLLDDMPCLTFDGDFRSLGLLVYPEYALDKPDNTGLTLKESAAIWKDRKDIASAEQYVRQMRKDTRKEKPGLKSGASGH